jgi:gamma-glutamyltranspeptidase / glutathione hydrolase
MAHAFSAVWPPLRAQAGDPDYVKLDVETLCSKAYARSLARPKPAVPPRTRGPGSQTTHLSVVDAERNVAAVTESVECYFGSGVTVPGTGVVLNDTMHDFDPEPGRPNSIAPGKRPLSNMVPTLLLRDSEPYLVLGSAGSARIVSSTLQTILNVVDHSLDIREAVAAPRFHYEGSGPIMMESRIGEPVRAALRREGFETETPDYVQLRPGYDVFFGGVHAVMMGRGGMRAAADPRRWGAAAAF